MEDLVTMKQEDEPSEDELNAAERGEIAAPAKDQNHDASIQDSIPGSITVTYVQDDDPSSTLQQASMPTSSRSSKHNRGPRAVSMFAVFDGHGVQTPRALLATICGATSKNKEAFGLMTTTKCARLCERDSSLVTMPCGRNYVSCEIER